ncbi:MAG TPA: hypothetical protein PLY93_00970 [Turneriella sp.]|nr:hypothetical protein [Turneriella sp.]
MSAAETIWANDTPTDLVPRRVLVLDFVNQANDKKSDYLSVSVAEALLDPLKQTGKFYLLPRDASVGPIPPKRRPEDGSRYDSPNGESLGTSSELRAGSTQKASITFDETEAVQIGKAADADVVVIGNFVSIGNRVQIQTKAVDVQTGQIAVAKTVSGKLDATIFDTIQKLATTMSQEMAVKLPPLPRREIIYGVGTSAYSATGDFIVRVPVVHGYLSGSFVWGRESKYVLFGYGAAADVSFQFLHRLIQPYFAANASFASGVTRVTTMNFFGFDAGLGYGITAPRYSPAGHSGQAPFLQGIQIRPVIGGGFQTGTIKTSYNIDYFVPSVFVGVVGDFFIHEKFSVALALKQYILIEEDTSLKIFTVQVGVGVRL